MARTTAWPGRGAAALALCVGSCSGPGNGGGLHSGELRLRSESIRDRSVRIFATRRGMRIATAARPAARSPGRFIVGNIVAAGKTVKRGARRSGLARCASRARTSSSTGWSGCPKRSDCRFASRYGPTPRDRNPFPIVQQTREPGSCPRPFRARASKRLKPQELTPSRGLTRRPARRLRGRSAGGKSCSARARTHHPHLSSRGNVEDRHPAGRSRREPTHPLTRGEWSERLTTLELRRKRTSRRPAARRHVRAAVTVGTDDRACTFATLCRA